MISQLGSSKSGFSNNANQFEIQALQQDIFKIRPDIIFAIQIFLEQMEINWALKGLFFLARLDNVLQNGNVMASKMYQKVLKIQDFVRKSLEIITRNRESEKEFMKLVTRSWGILVRLSKAII